PAARAPNASWPSTKIARPTSFDTPDMVSSATGKKSSAPCLRPPKNYANRPPPPRFPLRIDPNSRGQPRGLLSLASCRSQGAGRMGSARSSTANPALPRLPEAISGASVRVFACLGGDDLASELGALQVSEAAATARRLLPATAKLQVPLAWEESIARLVASHPRVTGYGWAPRGEAVTLLWTATVHDLEECAKALCLSEAPAALLGRDMLDQLSHIYPRTYGSLNAGGTCVDFSVKTGIMGILNVTPDSFYDGGRFVE